MTTSIATAEPPRSTDVPVFLTAYDPTDLPGTSVDPLGFERGYLFLADGILPGLTNAGNRPRYFSVLCAGACLARVDPGDPPRRQSRKRLDIVLRLERFWTLANALANVMSAEDDADSYPIQGIRGYRYVMHKLEALKESKAAQTDAEFTLLSRQVPYGMLGIYGAVADGMRLIERKTLTPTPDLGEVLGEAFLKETKAPGPLKKAVQEGSEVSVESLCEWGRRAHIVGPYGDIERQCLSEALHRHPVRSRMANVLTAHPFQSDEETELQRLERIRGTLAISEENRDLYQAVDAILAYENAYRIALLGFERLLWLCNTEQKGSMPLDELESDNVLTKVRADLPSATDRLNDAISAGQSFAQEPRLHDVQQFLQRAAGRCNSTAGLLEELLNRHTEIQRGKFDRGRRKAPWLELANHRISLTMARFGVPKNEVTNHENIAPHPYRLSSADRLAEAGRGA